MKKYIVIGLYIIFSCYLAFAQIVAFIFDPIFMLETPNEKWENIAYIIHPSIFIIFIFISIYLGRKLWKRLNR